MNYKEFQTNALDLSDEKKAEIIISTRDRYFGSNRDARLEFDYDISTGMVSMDYAYNFIKATEAAIEEAGETPMIPGFEDITEQLNDLTILKSETFEDDLSMGNLVTGGG